MNDRAAALLRCGIAMPSRPTPKPKKPPFKGRKPAIKRTPKPKAEKK